MSVAAGALWVFGITLALLWLGMIAVWLRESTTRDVFARVICQLAAYSLGLFGLLRVYAPETPIRQFLGLRRTHVGFYPLAVLLGLAVALPANVLYEQIHEWFPRSEVHGDVVTLFFEAGGTQRALIALSVVVLGPIIEEVVFRGALFGPMLLRNKVPVVVIATSAFFALVHLDAYAMVPILALGLMLAYLRSASGSLLPPILLHVSFNAVPLVTMASAESLADAQQPVQPPIALTLLATVVCIALLLGVRYLSLHTRTAVWARHCDPRC